MHMSPVSSRGCFEGGWSERVHAEEAHLEFRAAVAASQNTHTHTHRKGV